MERHEDDVKVPFIMKKENNNGWFNKYLMNNVKTVSDMRGDFIQRLPEKVKCGVDVEDPLNINFSAAKGLLQGMFFSFFHFFCKI
ncbi:hypothetical protein A4A49_13436 [Nicotiana attenuata]|uniref:Uncharacterized protein n=1 Tax=Nicotiana attenuata TaxID=49451 RepID=A0A1J6II67_NICAT|nr:hypothetical protein A4A49_13436 [Nicotiana attenuata]